MLTQLRTHRHKLTVALILLTAAMLLAACLTERLRPSFTRAGIMRDSIYSVEERGLGAVMVWVTHSEREAYCFTDKTLADRARSLIREHNGEVVIEYRAAGVLDSLNPCARTESDPQYTVYLGESLTTAPSR
jgi:hypothetical protein